MSTQILNEQFLSLPTPLLISIFSFDCFSFYSTYQLVCKNWSLLLHSPMGAKLLTLPLGHYYRAGTGQVNQNPKKALHLYKQAVSQGNDDATAWLAFCYLKIGNNEEAFHLSKIGVERNIPFAYRNLGYCYRYGRGVEPDLNKCIECYRKGTELGDAFSQNALAWSYENGFGVDQDIKEAIRLYRHAVEQGGAYAQCNLGRFYETGTGVEKNQQEAFRLYKLAAESVGDEVAQYNVGICYENGRGIEKDYREALVWYGKSAAQGYEKAKSKVLGALQEI